jgi:hypothetical protein
MDKIKAIQIIEKYKCVSRLLGLHEDEHILDEIEKSITNYNENASVSNNSDAQKKNKYGEADFQNIISSSVVDLSPYEINSQIILNKEKIPDYWHSLSEEEKNSFTIFELNIILYLLSNQYNKYQKKDKKRILSLISTVVKDKRMSTSYDNIIV